MVTYATFRQIEHPHEQFEFEQFGTSQWGDRTSAEEDAESANAMFRRPADTATAKYSDWFVDEMCEQCDGPVSVCDCIKQNQIPIYNPNDLIA